jgi:hypothetical protein
VFLAVVCVAPKYSIWKSPDSKANPAEGLICMQISHVPVVHAVVGPSCCQLTLPADARRQLGADGGREGDASVGTDRPGRVEEHFGQEPQQMEHETSFTRN